MLITNLLLLCARWLERASGAAYWRARDLQHTQWGGYAWRPSLYPVMLYQRGPEGDALREERGAAMAAIMADVDLDDIPF